MDVSALYVLGCLEDLDTRRDSGLQRMEFFSWTMTYVKFLEHENDSRTGMHIGSTLEHLEALGKRRQQIEDLNGKADGYMKALYAERAEKKGIKDKHRAR